MKDTTYSQNKMAEPKPKIEMKRPGMPESTKHQEKIIRILSTDIEGGMKVYPGLTKIKGISWSFSNAICNTLNIDKRKKLVALTEDEIKKITEFAKNPKLPQFMLNRKKDFETGEDKHLIGVEMEMRKDFDIKRMKKIKSYKGIRHMAGQPVRGQRTKAHFRTKKSKGVGIKKKAKPAEESTKLTGAQLK